jgi:hypothetical protein
MKQIPLMGKNRRHPRLDVAVGNRTVSDRYAFYVGNEIALPMGDIPDAPLPVAIQPHEPLPLFRKEA